MRSRRLFLLAVFVALLPCAARADNDPAAPIAAIYRKAAAGKGEDGGNFV